MDRFCQDCEKWYNPVKGHNCKARKSLAQQLLEESEESKKDSEPVKNNEPSRSSEKNSKPEENSEPNSDQLQRDRENTRRWREQNRERYRELQRQYMRKRRGKE